MNDYFEKINLIAKALIKKYPKGNDPFQIITRLCEEAGELAKLVNHFEKTGRKIEKYGPPDKKKLADEVRDLLHTAFQVAQYYGIEEDLKKAIDKRVTRYKRQGFV